MTFFDDNEMKKISEDEAIEREMDINHKKNWLIQSLGFIDYHHYLEFRSNAINGMSQFGDSFVKALANALYCADEQRSVKIINVFRNECTTHEIIYKMWKAKNRALKSEGAVSDEKILHSN